MIQNLIHHIHVISLVDSNVLREHSYDISCKKEVEFCDASCQTNLAFDDMEYLESCRNKLANKGELLRDMFVEKVTESDKNVQQYTGIPSKSVLNGLFGKTTTPNLY